VTTFTSSARILLLTLAVSAVASTAHAQGFISPFIGYNFGGDSACPTVTDCDSKSLNLGVSFGNINSLIGFEEEFAYARDFFKDPTVSNSSVLTLMSNVIIGPRIKYFRPYGVGGFGLMKARVELEPASLLSVDNNDLAWNIGGGLIIQSRHVGIRGDVRFFHGFTDLEVFGFPVSDLQLEYGRATVGVFFSY
jgi:hypothetical protein